MNQLENFYWLDGVLVWKGKYFKNNCLVGLFLQLLYNLLPFNMY